MISAIAILAQPSPAYTRQRTALIESECSASLGGMVGMIPGSHTYRDPWPGPRLHVAGPPDTGMRESWMAGKVNPATGLGRCRNFN